MKSRKEGKNQEVIEISANSTRFDLSIDMNQYKPWREWLIYQSEGCHYRWISTWLMDENDRNFFDLIKRTFGKRQKFTVKISTTKFMFSVRKYHLELQKKTFHCFIICKNITFSASQTTVKSLYWSSRWYSWTSYIFLFIIKNQSDRLRERSRKNDLLLGQSALQYHWQQH